MPTPLTLRADGNLAVLTLDDGRGNTLGSAMLLALRQALAGAHGASTLLVCGRAKVFSGGLDLAEVVPLGEAAMLAFLELFDATFRDLIAFDRPIVMAVAGSAVAGGAVLLACGDDRIGADDTGRVGANEVRLGIPFPATAREALLAGLGPMWGAHAMLTGDIVDKTEGMRRGWLHRLVPPERLLEVATARAHELATAPGSATGHVKRALRADHLERVDREGAPRRAAFAAAWVGADAQARLGAVLASLKQRG